MATRFVLFDRNPLRRSYFQGSDIQVSDDLDQLGKFDVLLEVTGDPEALDAILRLSPAGSTILLLGLPYAHKQFTFENIVTYDKTIVGSVGSSSQEFEEAIRLLPQLDLDAYLECIVPLDRFRDGWDLFEKREYLKVLLSIGGSPSEEVEYGGSTGREVQ